MKRKWLSWVVAIVAVSALAAGVYYMQNQPIEIKTISSSTGDVIELVSASGTLQANSVAKIFSPASGEVIKLYTKKGAYLEEDDDILKIEDWGRVEAPDDGNLMELYPAVGDEVVRGQVLAVQADIKPTYIIAAVDEADIAKVKYGQKVNIDFDSYEDAEVEGRVMDVGNISTRTSGGGVAFPVKIKITKIEGAIIRLGMSADVEIEVEERKDVVTVPVEAVDSAAGGDVVYIVGADNTIEQRKIELGLTTDDYYEVKTGLASNEKLASSNLKELKDGVKVVEK